MTDYATLVKEVEGRECRNCGSEPRVAWLNNEYKLRCNCYPKEPKLRPMRDLAAERLGNMVNGDVVEGRAIELAPAGGLPAPMPTQQVMTVEEFRAWRDLIKAVVADMVENVHYGKIPGTRGGKSLWEAGAEYLRAAGRIAWSFEIVDQTEDFQRHDYRYVVRAFQLVGPNLRGAEWEASAWSKERKFFCSGDCPKPCPQNHSPLGMDAADLPNNVKDRAIKRAFVNLIRNVTGTSGEFQVAQAVGDEAANGARSSVGAGAAADMGVCPKHGEPFQLRQGTARQGPNKGKPYSFWSCPAKDGVAYCKLRPQDWLAEQMKALGITSQEQLATEVDAYFHMPLKDWLASKPFAHLLGDMAEALRKPTDGPEGGAEAPQGAEQAKAPASATPGAMQGKF